MALKPRIDFFFDVISPYSWIAFEALTRYSTSWPVDLRYKPFNFAAVVKNNAGAPLKVEAKKWWLHYDVVRVAKYWEMELKMPTNHESIIFTKSSAPAQRLLNAAQETNPKMFIPLARTLWRRFYWQDKGFFEEEELLESIKDAGIVQPEELLAFSKTEKVKQMLRDHTKEALDAKAFGAPWMHAYTSNGELHYFFGSDSLPILAHTLGLPYKGSIS